MKLFKGAVPLILAGIGLFSGPAWASPITVGDFSFENAGLTNYNTNTGPSPWVYIDNVNEPNGFYHGLYVPIANTDYVAGSDGLVSGIVPDGTQVWREDEGKILQTLAATLQNNTTYNLSAWAGTPLTATGNLPNVVIAIGVTCTVTAGVCTAPGTTFLTLNSTFPNTPAAGHWTDELVSYNSGAANLDAGYPLAIRLANGNVNNHTDFDNVTLCTNGSCAADLSSVPEPSTVMLYGGGLAALGLIRLLRKDYA